MHIKPGYCGLESGTISYEKKIFPDLKRKEILQQLPFFWLYLIVIILLF